MPNAPLPPDLEDMADQEHEAPQRGGRAMDEELRCMGAMLRLLDDLESVKAQGRVVAWLQDRFMVGN